MRNNIKILVATHKSPAVIQNNIFLPVQVGASLNNYTIKPEYFKDNSGENISEKNNVFNELSALYWAWKNLNFDIIGLAHYRRYLDLNYKKPLFKKNRKHVVRNVKSDDIRLKKLRNVIKTEQKIVNFLKVSDIILPQKAFCTKENGDFESLTDQYKRFHHAADWQILVDVILEKNPEYSESIELYFNKGNIFYLCNMFITNSIWFNNYCEWLFQILFEVEKRIEISEDPFQKRVIGFLAERLFTLYILHHKSKVKELPILLISD